MFTITDMYLAECLSFAAGLFLGVFWMRDRLQRKRDSRGRFTK